MVRNTDSLTDTRVGPRLYTYSILYSYTIYGMSSLRAATTCRSSRSSVALPLPSRSGLKARRRCGCMYGFHQAGTLRLRVASNRVGDLGLAPWPHRRPPPGSERLGGDVPSV